MNRIVDACGEISVQKDSPTTGALSKKRKVRSDIPSPRLRASSAQMWGLGGVLHACGGALGHRSSHVYVVFSCVEGR